MKIVLHTPPGEVLIFNATQTVLDAMEQGGAFKQIRDADGTCLGFGSQRSLLPQLMHDADLREALRLGEKALAENGAVEGELPIPERV